MTRTLSNDDSQKLKAQIDRLSDLNREELEQHWQLLFGAQRPARLRHPLLIQALAYRLQENALGGLKPGIRRLLERVANGSSAARTPRELRRPQLKTGTVLIREWHGKNHQVTATEEGFLYCGKHYGSLSQIARAITATRWSGPLFFGLKTSAKEHEHGG
jgi:hypothetical protein